MLQFILSQVQMICHETVELFNSPPSLRRSAPQVCDVCVPSPILLCVSSLDLGGQLSWAADFTLPACVCACLFPARQFVSSGTRRWVWRATSQHAWPPACPPVCLCHLWVLVVSWHGWPMSLWVGEEPGLKYSSAVSAAGLVTAGHDIWVTRACRKRIMNSKNPDVTACCHLKDL